MIPYIISLLLLTICKVNGDPITNFTKPNPLPKYFAIDVDRTFYIDNEDMMKKNVEAFKLLKSKNITPFFCTGRQPESVKSLFGDDFFTDTGYNRFPGVYCNGSLVYDTDGSILYLDKLSDNYLEKFKQYLDDNNLIADSFFYTDDGLYCVGTPSDKTKNFITKSKMSDLKEITFDNLKTKNVTSVVWFDTDLRDNTLKSEVYFVHFKNDGTCQISQKTSNKKVGLEKLLEKLNSNKDECAYIGDSVNDIEALGFCSTSFAVANAVDGAKQRAKWVMDLKYDEGAFAKAVDLLLN